MLEVEPIRQLTATESGQNSNDTSPTPLQKHSQGGCTIGKIVSTAILKAFAQYDGTELPSSGTYRLTAIWATGLSCLSLTVVNSALHPFGVT